MAVKTYTRRLCDRCATEKESLRRAGPPAHWMSMTVNGIRENSLPEKFDLCPSCAESFMGWWKAGIP